MIESVYIATTGLRANQAALDVVSHNISNLNTAAYKRARAVMNEIITEQPVQGVGMLSAGAASVSVGAGAAMQGVSHFQSQGDLKMTGEALDVAIEGNGYLEVELPNGSMAYTRVGTLMLSEDGFIQTKNGYKLSGHISVPVGMAGVTIQPDGSVLSKDAASGEIVELGRIELATFSNNEGLEAVGNGFYIETETSGVAQFGVPGEDAMGVLRQGYVETSNVDLVEELMELVTVQRAYEASSQVVRAADELVRMTNSLRGNS